MEAMLNIKRFTYIFSQSRSFGVCIVHAAFEFGCSAVSSNLVNYEQLILKQLRLFSYKLMTFRQRLWPFFELKTLCSESLQM